jgi:DNA invertase Pin-like site-specific DNA recombinase
VRVSHVGRRDKDSERFRADRDQIDAIRRKARDLDDPVEILQPDLNRKGSDPERETLLRAIEGVERGTYKGIIVAYLSRASRRARWTMEMWDRVEAAGGRLIAVRENIDTAIKTPEAKLHRNLLAAIAEHELDVHAEQFALLRAAATSAGIWQRRQTPLGYARDPGTRRLVPDADAPRVAHAFRARGAGTTISEIGRHLGMTTSGARHLLRNRVYLGELRVGENVNPAAHPAIVTEEMWIGAQRPVATRPARGANREPALLAGLVRCCGCGHVMSRSTQTRAVVYICHGHHSAGACPHPAGITARLVEQHVVPIAFAELSRLRATASRGDHGIRRARAALRAAERELTTYLEAVSAADVGAEAFAAGARPRREAVEDARDQLAAALATRPTPVEGDPVKAWERLNGARRNRLLRGLIETVLVARAGGPGARRAVPDRVRVIKHGAGLINGYAGGGVAMPIRTTQLPDLDDPLVLRV